jgi:mannosylglycerate hydrolase
MRNLHIISHTHWDREWYRPFQSFRLMLVQLIDGLLDLLEKDPQFKYFMLDGQTIVLDDYLAMRPEKEAILRKHIQKGRIVIGPWHILPDMFLVGPEAHIRNLLRGDQTARKFGPKMMIGYIPDPFGHPGQVPQILRGFGIETACLWRGLDEEPAEFWWQSPDGSRVLMAYLRDSYSNGASLPADNPSAFAGALTAAADSLQAHSGVSDYLIMYGTDHMEPPPDTSKAITYADKVLKETHVVHSTLPKFVAAVQVDIKRQKLSLPTVTGELRACKRMHLLPGVLSTRMWIKQRNHASENLLTKWVEPFTTWQERVTGTQSAALNQKSAILNQAWHLLMENHPHDSICGCSIDQVHEEMKVRFDQVDQIGEELARQSLETLAQLVNTAGLPAIVIFNPTSAPRTDAVEAAVESPDPFDLLDDQGNVIPYQILCIGSQELIYVTLKPKDLQALYGAAHDGKVMGMSIQDLKIKRKDGQVTLEAVVNKNGVPNSRVWKESVAEIEKLIADPAVETFHIRAHSAEKKTRLIFVPQIPSLGWRTYHLRPRATETRAPTRLGPATHLLLALAKLPFFQKLAIRSRYAKPPYRIENDLLTVEAMKDGTLIVTDKATGAIYRGLNRFLDGGDCGDEYNFSPPPTDRFTSPRLKRVTLARGPVQQSLEIELELKTPVSLVPSRKSRSNKQIKIPVTTMITLTNGVPRVDIRTTLENNARDHRLRVHFPAPFATCTGSQDGHFEVVERKVGLPAFDDTWVEQPRPEVPQRAFTDISDDKSGLMLANRGLPEVEVLKNPQGNAEIALTLLRSVGWLSRDDFSTRKGHAGPFMETPVAQMPGKWAFDYSIIPHAGNWQSAFWQAYAFDAPLRAVTTGVHAGDLPPAGSFVETNPVTFVISAVKQAEDGLGWLVRGYNITDEAITVTLKPWKLFNQVDLVNLAEEKLAPLKPDQAGRVTIPVRGHEIVSVLFEAQM